MSHKLRDKIAGQAEKEIRSSVVATTYSAPQAQSIITAALDEYAEGFKAELSRAQNAYSKMSHEPEDGYPEGLRERMAKALELIADLISSLDCEGIEVDEYQERLKEIGDGTKEKWPVQGQTLQRGLGRTPRESGDQEEGV